MQQHTALQAKQRAVVRRKMEEADAARRRLRVRGLLDRNLRVKISFAISPCPRKISHQFVSLCSTEVHAWRVGYGPALA